MSVYDILAELPYFSSLPEEELETLCQSATMVDVAAGDVIMQEGQEVDALMVVAEGAFEVTRRAGTQDVVVGVAGTGEVLGEMSFLEGRPASATLTALSDARLVRLPAAKVDHILSHLPFLKGMFLTMIMRLRERESSLVHAEKLVALGTMTAGLLHEVNNPAAAIKRSAAGLVHAAEGLLEPGEEVARTALERAELEEELGEFLDEKGVADAFEVATSLVALGWDAERLESVAGGDEAEIARLAQLAHARQLAGEVAMAAERLSELVEAVKTWVYLDQGPRQQFDLNQAVRQTIALLRHKLGQVDLQLELDPELPAIEASGAELNQVLTNLVDNAIHAARTRVTVRTRVEGDELVGEVEDDGAGISPELVERIWEPFFTTKPPGEGSGLGLSISRRIVESHRGRLLIQQNGSTRFVIRLPIPTS
ncbi:MAG TPA: ATP-binding protein [Acidimicrobiia bacterium]|nr:ATP-binding protein [Acidimicrobiia bacterium]